MLSSKQTIELFEGKTTSYTSEPQESLREVMTFQVVGTLGAGDSVDIEVSLAQDSDGATFQTVHTFDSSSTYQVENMWIGEGSFYRAVFTSANNNSTSCYAK